MELKELYKNYNIIDDVISKGYQNLIEDIFTSTSIPWQFLANVTDNSRNEKLDISGFTYTLLNQEDQFKSECSDLLIPLLFEAVDKCEKGPEIKEILRIRAGMFIRNQTDKPHESHVDRDDFHYTMLYYVNDSDGPTSIFDYKGEKVIQEIEPKKGRVLIMTGDTYHSSSSPKNHIQRIVINYNFLV